MLKYGQEIELFILYPVIDKKWSGCYCMDNEESKCHENEKEGTKMAVLAKPINRVPLVKKEESRNFVRAFNDNKVSKDFLDSCKKAGKLFERRK